MSSTTTGLGRHLLLECHGCAPGNLLDAEALERLLRRAAKLAGAHVLFGHFHPFGPAQGVTGVLLLRESHISIHTWPEHGYAAVDVFMCGATQPENAVAEIVRGLGPQRHEIHDVQRGVGLVALMTHC